MRDLIYLSILTLKAPRSEKKEMIKALWKIFKGKCCILDALLLGKCFYQQAIQADRARVHWFLRAEGYRKA